MSFLVRACFTAEGFFTPSLYLPPLEVVGWGDCRRHGGVPRRPLSCPRPRSPVEAVSLKTATGTVGTRGGSKHPPACPPNSLPPPLPGDLTVPSSRRLHRIQRMFSLSLAVAGERKRDGKALSSLLVMALVSVFPQQKEEFRRITCSALNKNGWSQVSSS